jgi:hypothetical protein
MLIIFSPDIARALKIDVDRVNVLYCIAAEFLHLSLGPRSSASRPPCSRQALGVTAVTLTCAQDGGGEQSLQ